MPITINGSGSITGISAGGLPDATIVQADLAANVAGNGPAFSAYAGTDQAITASTYTKVSFGTEVFDTNNNFASSRFTPTVAGYYSVCTNIYTSGTPSATQISFYKNGSVYSTPVYVSASYVMQGASDLIYCNGTTDYIEVYFYNQFSTTIGGSAGSQYVRFAGAMVRAA